MQKRLAIEWLIFVRLFLLAALGPLVWPFIDSSESFRWAEQLTLSPVVGLALAPVLYLVLGAVRLTLAASRVAYFSDGEGQ